MISNRRFSVREVLLGTGRPEDLLRLALEQAWRFLQETTARDAVDGLFARAPYRRAVGARIADHLHLGFMLPGSMPAPIRIRRLCAEAGFRPVDGLRDSTLLARELGGRLGGSDVPISILTADFPSPAARPSGIELFLAKESPERIGRWVAEEAGTHLGLLLSDPAAFAEVHDCFVAEGFEVPAFLRGRPGVTARPGQQTIFYDRLNAGRTQRVEVTIPARERSSRPHRPAMAVMRAGRAAAVEEGRHE